ncbi:hypothetical protein MYX82_04575 [Acidobacteria bacterium AH-259-D05]|nr:hypothetical protein [Acidobacteria bacterium AH-259-D05]
MHGINLSEPTEDLWEEVENLYGMSIDLVVDELPAGFLGQAEVLSDGQPRIMIDNERGRSEQNVAHELSHLKLRKEGYGQYGYQFPSIVQGGDELRDWVEFNNSTLREPLLHRLFYPKMIEIGLEPDEGMKEGLSDLIKKGDYLGVTTENAFKVHTVNFFKSLIESNDDGYLSELESWFIDQGWSKSIERAKAFRDLVEIENPRTPRDEMEIFIELLDRMYGPAFSFEIDEWSTRTCGSHEEQFARIRVRVTLPQ